MSGSSGTQQSSEDEQIKAAKRIALIQHLPIHQFTKENFQLKKNSTECDICMNDFAIGEFRNLLSNVYLLSITTTFSI